LACDGLWDTVGRDQAIELVRNHISSGNDRGAAAKLLVDAAKTSGSSDNISVIVVYLDAHAKSSHNESPSNKKEVASSSHNNSSHNISTPLTTENQTSPSNGDHINNTSNPTCNSVAASDKENNHNEDGPHVRIVEKKESHESIVAKVKITSESSKTGKTKCVTCKVTSEKHDSCRNGACSSEKSTEKTKSAENSPKATSKSKAVKSQKLSQPSKAVKGKSQLGVASEGHSRRKSAPADVSSSPSAKT